MHTLHRFNEIVRPLREDSERPADLRLPRCAHELFPLGELRDFPGFVLMRLARDWVEGYDEANDGLWLADRPRRLYEGEDSRRLCAAHALVGHLCAVPEHSLLRDENLLRVACDRYWCAPETSPADQLEQGVGGERAPGRSGMAPWWRAAAMLRDPRVDLAAAGMHWMWLKRGALDLAALTDERPGLHGEYVDVEAVPPLQLRAVLTEVFGPNQALWPAFERAVLQTLSLDSTLEEALDYEPEPDSEELSGLSLDELFGY